jgi:dUTP pyrophosphatase
MNEMEQFLDSIKNLADMSEEDLNDDVIKAILGEMDKQFTPQVISQSVNQIVKNLEDQDLNKAEAKDAIDALIETMKELIYGEEQFTPKKKVLVDTLVDKIFNIFNAALEKYHSYAIELPMTVDTANGAQVPTYAHDTDAAADLYSMDDVVVPAHSYGNKLRTGVKIQLPEGWLAFILPRSSIGAKTPLRLSNSVGLIDSGYRGELGILYDNTSDEDYHINQGDRIAQLLVMPSYRFQAKVVDILANSDRGETGFGDSGK